MLFSTSIARLWGLPVYHVQAIGPAGYASAATAMNAAGAVAGNFLRPDGTYAGFVWRDGTAMELGLPAGAVQSWALALTGTGQAGGYVITDNGPRGAVWDSAGNASAGPGAYIRGFNEAGDAAGMAILPGGSGQAFVTRHGAQVALGQPGGGDWSTANAINASGTAAGTAMTGAGNFTGFAAGADGTVTLLGALGGANSYAKAINGAGTVAGHAQTAGGALLAAIWNGSGPLALGTLGGTNSYAYAINSAGHVAGYSDLPGGAGTAAFLSYGGGMYDLNLFLEPGSGWRLLAAYAINDSGQIAGRGLYNGIETAFLLTPQAAPSFAGPGGAPEDGVATPEPAAVWLGGVGLLGLLALRARARLRVR